MDNTKHLTGFFFSSAVFSFSEIAQRFKKRNGPSLELLIIVCACGHLQLVTHFQYSKTNYCCAIQLSSNNGITGFLLTC